MFKHFLSNITENQTGSTLVQIPITLAIIGGLVAFSAHAADVLPEARDTRRAAEAYQITVALELYYADHGSYPKYVIENTDTSWDYLDGKLEPEYIQELPQDPQYADEGMSYRYWSDGQQAKVFWTSEADGTVQERWTY